MSGSEKKELLGKRLKTSKKRSKNLERLKPRHKSTEPSLLDSEEKYKAFFQYGAEGLLVADVKTKRLKYANPALCRMLGYSEDEIKRMGVRDIHPKDFLEHVISEFEAQARKEKTLASDIPCLRKDGKLIYADINTTNVVIDGREFNVGFFTDVTKRKISQDELNKVQAKFRTLVEQIPAVTYIAALDKTSTTLYVSPQIKDLLGFSQEEYERDPDIWCKRLHPEDKERVMTELEYAHRSSEPFCCEYRMLARDGHVVWFRDEAVTVKDSENRPLFLQGVMFDITERKKTEEALQQSEKRLRLLFQHSFDGINICEVDLKTRRRKLVMCNDKYVEMSGYSREELFASENLNDLIKLHGPRKNKKLWLNLIKGEKAHSGECSWIRPDGKENYYEWAAAPIQVEGKYYNIGIDRDITERKRIEQTLRKAREELELRVQQRTTELEKLNLELTREIDERKRAKAKLLDYQDQLRFLASELSLAEENLRRRVAMNVHDNIGQNLAIAKIKVESLKKSNFSSDTKKTLNEVRDLLAEAIEKSRMLTSELSPPVLYDLGFEAAVDWLVRRIRQRSGISAEFVSDCEEKPLDDNIQIVLFQALRELLVNVTKHSHAKRVNVSVRRLNSEMVVTVEDDGIGFDVAKVRSQTNKQKGGFGLFSIRERLSYIGGHFSVESKSGSGTRITLVAPLAEKKTRRKRKLNENKNFISR